jgi:hypothetical protein
MVIPFSEIRSHYVPLFLQENIPTAAKILAETATSCGHLRPNFFKTHMKDLLKGSQPIGETCASTPPGCVSLMAQGVFQQMFESWLPTETIISLGCNSTQVSRLNRHVARSMSQRSSICSENINGFHISETSTWVCLKIGYADVCHVCCISQNSHFHPEDYD